MKQRWLVGICCAIASASVAANAIRVPDGATLSLSSGEVRTVCADLHVGGLADAGSGAMRALGDVAIDADGALAGGSARIEVGGDWRNLGTFLADSSAVVFVDGCGASSTLSGDLAFHDLEIRSDSGRSIVFPAGSTTTVAGHLVIDGGDGAPVDVRSSNLAQSAAICLLEGATATLASVDLDAGNVQLLSNGCSGGGVAPPMPLIVPATSRSSILALFALMLALGLGILHRRNV